ncbi:MAG: stkP 3 [Planctomycetaceae bacterium]|nr:stkP 3 [Planctomycetaceae bacterium]
MPVPLDKFIQQLEESGILVGDTIKDFVPPQACPKDAEELAKELVRKKKLTRFQAEEVYKGKGKSLVLGNYVLLEKIGSGGMGQVFKAEHRRMKRVVAIKLLPAAMTRDKASIARFEREVEAAAKISHANIVAAHDADCFDGVHFLVMELVEGSDLSAVVKKNGPLSVEQSINFILQAARGLEAAHKKGIVHRDIKPANLLLDNNGVVKILDMGLARLSLDGNDAPQADLTSTGMIMGTVDYMSPEQALDTKSADARSDIYALGCSLYFLLTGKSTYDGDTLMKKLLAHREQPLPSLRAVRPEATEQLDFAFKKMVAKKVEDRLQSMADVIVELQRCTTGSMPAASHIAPPTTTFDGGEFDFLGKLSAEPTIRVSAQHKAEPSPDGRRYLKITIICAGLLGIAIVTGLFFRGSEPKASPRSPQAEKTAVVEAKPTVPAVVEPQNLLGFQRPGFDKWVRDVAAMPVDKQVEAVNRKLVELNPAFNGKVSDGSGTGPPQIENGVVIGYGFLTDNVTDLSPVRALVGLQVLFCNGSNFNRGQLSDLSPLEGMKLVNLACYFNPVSDLSPLRQLPLRGLAIYYTDVSDLAPLAGLPLENLDCGGLPVTDLTPLMSCKHLGNLFLTETKVTPAGIVALQKALPQCTIKWDDPAREKSS